MSTTDTDKPAKSTTRPEPVIVAEHRYPWTVGEALTVVVFPVLATVFVVYVGWEPTNPLFWGFGISGWIGGGLLFNLNLTRKSASHVRLHQEGGQWLIERGGVLLRSNSNRVTLKKVNHVVVTDGPYRTKDLSLSVVDRMTGATKESLKLPARLVRGSQEVRERLQPIVEAHADPADTEVKDMTA